MKIIIYSMIVPVLFIFTLSANAALIERGYGKIIGNIDHEYQLIYDDELDVTWLDYTNGYDDWYNQIEWAENMEVSFDGHKYTAWRLPSAGENPSIDGGLDSTELGHLCYDLRENDHTSPRIDPFLNLEVWDDFWFSTEYGDHAWLFNFQRVEIGTNDKSTQQFAIAMMDGDVGDPVPEPSTIFLLGIGLLGLVGIKSRKKKS